jgi:UDP-N-acetyl-D-glucosamine dehydrogenase
LETLKTKILYRKATAAVIGLGYVGLPLALEIVSAGFNVVGIDLDQYKISRLKEGQSYIGDVSEKTITDALATGRFTPTTDFSGLRDVDKHLRPHPIEQKPRSGHFFYLVCNQADP